MSKRALGTIESIAYDSDHGSPPAMYIHIRFPDFHTAFGGFCMDTEATDKDYKDRLCRLLGVERIEDATGKQVFGLWCLGEWNEAMEGLENLTGERFTISGFRRIHWPNSALSAMDSAKNAERSTIAWAERRAAEARAKLASLEANWTEWETAPATVV